MQIIRMTVNGRLALGLISGESIRVHAIPWSWEISNNNPKAGTCNEAIASADFALRLSVWEFLLQTLYLTAIEPEVFVKQSAWL